MTTAQRMWEADVTHTELTDLPQKLLSPLIKADLAGLLVATLRGIGRSTVPEGRTGGEQYLRQVLTRAQDADDKVFRLKDWDMSRLVMLSKWDKAFVDTIFSAQAEERQRRANILLTVMQAVGQQLPDHQRKNNDPAFDIMAFVTATSWGGGSHRGRNSYDHSSSSSSSSSTHWQSPPHGSGTQTPYGGSLSGHLHT